VVKYVIVKIKQHNKITDVKSHDGGQKPPRSRARMCLNNSASVSGLNSAWNPTVNPSDLNFDFARLGLDASNQRIDELQGAGTKGSKCFHCEWSKINRSKTYIIACKIFIVGAWMACDKILTRLSHFYSPTLLNRKNLIHSPLMYLAIFEVMQDGLLL